MGLILSAFTPPSLSAPLTPGREDSCHSLLETDRASWIDTHHSLLLEGYALPESYRAHYYARRIEPYLEKSDYDPVVDPKKLYRGMFLSPEDLSLILKHGMSLNRVTWTAGGGGISFSSRIQEAASYLFQSGNGSGLGVVFEVDATPDFEPLPDASLNPNQTIYKLHRDLEPSRIREIYLWGNWGLESILEIIQKAGNNRLTPHSVWTGVFDRPAR